MPGRSIQTVRGAHGYRLPRVAAVVLVVVAGLTALVLDSGRAPAADGSGTAVASPTNVHAGTTQQSYTLTFTAAETMDAGALTVTAPAGWTAPQGTNGVAGYTTVSSAAGKTATALHSFDSTTGWSASPQMSLSSVADAETGFARAFPNSLQNAISAGSAANDQWYVDYGAAVDWGNSLGPTSAANTFVGFWVKSTISTGGTDLAFANAEDASVATPQTVNLAPLTANTWAYQQLQLSGATATRNATLSWGIRQLTDLGSNSVAIDGARLIVDDADAATGWDKSTAEITIAATTDRKEGSNAIGAAIAVDAVAGDRWYYTTGQPRDWSAFSQVGFWVKSDVTTSAGDLEFEYSSTASMGSVIAQLSVPALTAGQWQFVALTLSGTVSTMRSYGLRMAVDIGAANVIIDGIGLVIDNLGSTTGWSTSTASNNIGLAAVADAGRREGSAELDATVPAGANVGDRLGVDLGGAADWSAYTNAGLWLKASTNLNANTLAFAYDDTDGLVSPIESVNISDALTVDTWAFVKVAFGATTRTAVRSWGITFVTDPGAVTLRLDEALIGPAVPTFSGQTATVKLLSLANDETVVFTYGSGGGVAGATAPSTAATHTFTMQSRMTTDQAASAALADIGTSPTIATTNTTPAANAGTDQSVDEATLVTLNGTASSDTDSDPITYAWSQTSGTAVTLSSTTVASPTFTAPAVSGSPVTLTFQLIVNDGFASSSADTIDVTVSDVATPTPTATATAAPAGSGGGEAPAPVPAPVATETPQPILSQAGGAPVTVTGRSTVAASPSERRTVEAMSERADLSVDIPAGAFDSGTTVSVSVGADNEALRAAAPPPVGVSLLASVIVNADNAAGGEITGSLSTPVTLSGTLNPGAVPADVAISRLALATWSGDEWLAEPATFMRAASGAVTFRATLRHLSMWAVVTQPSTVFVGTRPRPGQVGLLLRRGLSGTPAADIRELLDFDVDALFVLDFGRGRFVRYIPGAPDYARESFTLSSYQVFLARAALPPTPTHTETTPSTATRPPAHSVAVGAGESLIRIAERYGVDWQEFARLNGITGPDYVLWIGRTLTLPAAAPAALAAPASPPTTPSTPPVTAVTVTVQVGDTLIGIAERAGLDWPALARANGISGPDYFVHPGQTLMLEGVAAASVPGSSVVVGPGDTLIAIADRHGLDWLALARLNNLAGPDYIVWVGLTLRLE